MRKQPLRAWLLPALLGPWVATSVLVTVAVLLGPDEPMIGGPFEHWVVGMVVGTVGSMLLTLAMLAVDAARIERGTPPPVGPRAWLGAALAPLLATCVYAIFPPARYDGPWYWLTLAGPLLAAPLLARVLTWRG